MSGRPRGTVLAYHAIGNCPDDRHNLFIAEAAFEAQMEHLARRHRVVPLSTIAAGRGHRGDVAISFDDAYVSVLEVAAPVLRRHGFPATVFVPTAHIGKRNGWDEPSHCPLEILDRDGLRAAQAHGLEVESHGHGHIDMTAVPPEQARADMERSIEILEDLLGRRPLYIAYPYRSATPAAAAHAQELGFHAAFSIDLPHRDRFAFERVQVTPRDGKVLFALKATGLYIPLRYSRPARAAVAMLRRARG